MLHRTHNTREWMLVIAFSVFTLCFMLWVLLESRGTVQYPQWHTVKGHDYYQVFDRTLLPIFPICVFTVDLFVAGLTLWVLHRGAYLASFSIGLGTLLLMGISCQMFFEGFGKYLLTLISGCVMLIGACWLSRHPRIALTKRLHIRHAIAAMIVLLILLNVVFGKTINGSRAWVYFGPLHFQPGELFKPLLVLYGAFCFPCRQIKQLFPFLALSLSVVLLLVFIKDLGNAAIISVLMLVICWYLSDKLTLTAGLLSAGISLGTIALHFRPALQNRFNSFQALASGSGQQYDGLLAILHNGLHGSGLAEGSGYLRSTCVTAAYNDVAALLPISIFGIGFAVLLLFSLIVLLLSPARNSGHSPFLLVLQSGCAAILFAQAALNLGASLNVLPLTGVSFPILSSGGNSMIANFSLIGFLIGGFTYETETALQTLHVSYHGAGSSVPLRHRYRKFVATCRRNARRYVRQSVSGFRGNAGAMGSVYDRSGSVLWSPEQPAQRAFYSLLGAPYQMIQNSVFFQYQIELLGKESYSAWQEAKSLNGSGSDLFLTLDANAQQTVSNLLEANGVSGLVAACDASTGALRCLVSTPAAGPDEVVDTLPEGALLNKTLYTPQGPR